MKTVFKLLKKYVWYIVVLVFLVGIIILTNTIKMTSSTAKYHSEVAAFDESRVAKWNIDYLSSHMGKTLDIKSSINKTLDAENIGNWFVEVTNNSEVSAHLDKNSYIRFRIDHSTYDKDSPSTISWNFLKDSSSNPIVNPVTLKVTLYDKTIDDLIVSYKKGSTNITKDAYNALSEAEKNGYIEVLNSSAFSKELFITTDITLTKGLDPLENTYYYYTDVKMADLVFSSDEEIKAQEKNLLELLVSETNKTFTVCISWTVDQDSQSGGDGTLDTKKYNAYEVLNQDEDRTGYIIDGTYKIGDATYYIAHRSLDFFNYQIFTSGFGGDGEPYYEFDGSVVGSKVLVYHSRLDTEGYTSKVLGYKNDHGVSITETTTDGVKTKTYNVGTTLSTRSSSGTLTLQDLQEAVDYFVYDVHKEFINDNKSFQESLTYLSYGLSCKLQFHLIISQMEVE